MPPRSPAGGTFATARDYTVQLLKRTAAGQAEVHTKETDIFYVVDGDSDLRDRRPGDRRQGDAAEPDSRRRRSRRRDRSPEKG